MPAALAIRHVAFEDLGTLDGALRERGYDVRMLDAGVDDFRAVDAPDLLIVLGGPIGVYESDRYPFLADEIALIARQLDAGRPLLGICLGAQLIAAAAGARVFASGAKEIGWAPIEPTAAGAASALAPLGEAGWRVLHWHGDTFDLPQGAQLLASTAATPNQAFSLGPSVLALQFHIEVEHHRFEQWLIGHTLELSAAGIDVAGLRADCVRYGSAVQTAGKRCLARWLDRLETAAQKG